MGFVRCELPHPLFIILTERCLAKTGEDYPGLPFPQNATEVEADFLNLGSVLALVDDRQADNPRISFCTPRYELVCGLTQQKDAWYAIRMAPLGLRVHNQLARGALQVIPQTWGMVNDLGEFNRDLAGDETPTGAGMLLEAWRQTRSPGKPSAHGPASTGNSAAELAFLANLDTLIDLACEVELEQAARQERIPVRVGEALATTKWRFYPSGAPGIRLGDYLTAGSGESLGSLDGVVVEVTGKAFVVRFFQPPDQGQIQKITWFIPKVSTKQYTIQHEAIRALRSGQSLNPHLLGLIVENRFAEYPAPAVSSGTGRPNPAQKTMIERALVVPDLLLTLGPPGTGKTETIRALVKRQSALGRKVLITSKNNKAVDNVLDGLDGVHALRIGREEVVDPSVRALLIDQRASAMQAKIHANLQPVEQALARGLENWPQIQAALAQLSGQITIWQSAQSALEQEQAYLSGWQTAAFTRIEGALDRQRAHMEQLRARLEQTRRHADGLRRQLESLQRFSQTPLIGGLVVLYADRVAREWQVASQQYRAGLEEISKTQETAHRMWEAYRQFVTASAQALRFKVVVAAAETALEQSRHGMAQVIDDLHRLSQGLPGAPVAPSVFSGPALEKLFNDWQAWHKHQTLRQDLLGEWRDMLQTRPQALYPPLIRSADVIGATCIGVATDARFEDLEFDLVIADEAGQIQVMDLLVPLVRARRAVLVGDHLQLPPLVEPEIVQKIREREPENQELGEWLEKSLFERLIERPATPASHKVMLDTQYRMPRQIADFISGQFYDGNYRTGAEKPHADPFFSGSPLVFIDTAKEVRHFEQRAEDGQGYFNATEARLVCDLVQAYQAHQSDLGVIVPYKKQAEVIRRELRKRQLGWSEDELTSRVATVDSFQGKEQDVIVFGFTRSNADGRIGFLAELRRLNVSLTRARRQLILVGDSQTLSSTPDQDFARLVQSLLASARSTPKGYLYASELPRRLQA